MAQIQSLVREQRPQQLYAMAKVKNKKIFLMILNCKS